jgi:hypothetical protein
VLGLDLDGGSCRRGEYGGGAADSSGENRQLCAILCKGMNNDCLECKYEAELTVRALLLLLKLSTSLLNLCERSSSNLGRRCYRPPFLRVVRSGISS